MAYSELKPCLFPHIDGGGQYMTIHERSSGIPFQAQCLICGARGPVARTKEEAIVAWNNGVSKVKCNAANKTANGKCLGYQNNTFNDMPIKQCQDCYEYESYDDFHIDGYDD